MLEKYATRMGGATNHRMRLDDGVMIKDNHIAVAGGVDAAVRAAKAAGLHDIVVEVDRIDQISPALVLPVPTGCCSITWGRRCCAKPSS